MRPFIFTFLLLTSLCAAAYVEPAVEDAINANGSAKVIFVYKEANKDRLSLARAFQNLKKPAFRNFDFWPERNFRSFPLMSGNLTRRGLSSLRNHPSIEGIFFDYPIIASSASLDQINATSVQSKIIRDQSLRGRNQTICVIDTGIDYRHESFGGCFAPTNGSLQPATQANSLDSAHNYSNDLNQTFTITKSGFSRIAVHFVNVSTENGYDLLYVEDRNGRVVASYSGLRTDFWTPSVSGDTILLRLVTDSGVTGYGFTADLVNNGTTPSDVTWSCPKVIGGYDFVNSDFDPLDDNGHGTHVAGIAAGNGSVLGVAPDAKLLAMKVLDGSGSGSTSDMIAALDYCTTNKATYNTSVVSLSLGTLATFSSSCNTRPEALAVLRANEAGLFVAMASGNTGSTGVSSPSCATSGIATGSVSSSDAVSSFSNAWTNFMLLAPGESINSSLVGNSSGEESGTSMATPHLSGAVALIQQFSQLSNGSLSSPDYLKTLLNSTGKRVIDSKVSTTFSRIDVLAALNLLRTDISPSNIQPISFTNNSNTTSPYAVLNFSYEDDSDASSCTLEFTNGTSVNYSPALGRRYCYVNITRQRTSVSNFSIYVNDTYNNPTRAYFSLVFLGGPPTDLNVVSPRNNSFVNTPYVSVNYTFSDNDPHVCTVDFDGTNSMAPANATSCSFSFPAADGTHNFTVFVNDTLGNATQNGTFFVTVDTTFPSSLAFLSPTLSNDSVTQNNGVYVNFTFTETNPDTCVLEFNNGTAVNTTMSRSGTTCFLNRTLTNQGIFNYTVFVNDSAGYATSSLLRFIRVDRTAPTLESIIAPRGNNGTAFNVSINASDNLFGSLNVSAFFANNSIQAFSNSYSKDGNIYNLSFSLPSLAAGNYTLNVTVTDNASLSFSNNTLTLAYDTSPPSAPSISVFPDASGFFSLNWTGDLDVFGIASYQVFRNFSLLQTTSSRSLSDFSISDNATYDYFVRVFDISGNSADSLVTSAYVQDTVLPTLTTAITLSNNSNGSVQLSWNNVTSDVSGVREKNVAYRIFRSTNVSETNASAMSWIGNASGLSYLDGSVLLPATEYLYAVVSVDSAGNSNVTILSGNSKAHTTVSACTNDYSDYSACSGGSQSRTRFCLGAVQTQTQSCGGSGDSSSTTASSSSSFSSSSGGTSGASSGGSSGGATGGVSGGGFSGSGGDIIVVYGIPKTVAPIPGKTHHLDVTLSSYYTGFINYLNITVKGIPQEWYNTTLPRVITPISNSSASLDLDIPSDATGNYTVEIELSGVGTKSFGKIRVKKTFQLILPSASRPKSSVNKTKIPTSFTVSATPSSSPIAVLTPAQFEPGLIIAVFIVLVGAFAMALFKFWPGPHQTKLQEFKNGEKEPSLKGQVGVLELLDANQAMPHKRRKTNRRKNPDF